MTTFKTHNFPLYERNNYQQVRSGFFGDAVIYGGSLIWLVLSEGDLLVDFGKPFVGEGSEI